MTNIEKIHAAYLNAAKRRSNTEQPIISKGTVYFNTFNEAREHGDKHGKGFPSWRVVSFGLGHAVQMRISGPYMDINGQAS
tara:strand:+ start:213 stop:455 length:243 start_codon:yes stop_codon:yes gene_type:complete